MVAIPAADVDAFVGLRVDQAGGHAEDQLRAVTATRGDLNGRPARWSRSGVQAHVILRARRFGSERLVLVDGAVAQPRCPCAQVKPQSAT